MSKTALVVEDTPANRDFFERLLTQAGFDVKSASTGQDALKLLKEFTQLDLAVVDMEMPDMSGLHLTTHIKRAFANTYTIIATMHDQKSLIDSAISKGCNLFLVKPHGFMELFKLLTEEEVSTLCQRPPHVLDQYGLRPYTISQDA